ncbi:MAG: GNAT family N-acetyltransferase [Clostridia bacterium]|nr:GNAT family N-acetyltransferase [Clostridia bacterium]
MEFLKATAADIAAVVTIYDAVRNSEFCAWNEYYPTQEHAVQDMETGCLYVLKEDGEVITCASVEPIAEDDDLPFWKINDGTHREISRVAVAPGHQGKRLAGKIVGMLLEELKRNGVSSIHLLASKTNPPAFRTYRALGFDFIGECYRYGTDYFVCEKILTDR